MNRKWNAIRPLGDQDMGQDMMTEQIDLEVAEAVQDCAKALFHQVIQPLLQSGPNLDPALRRDILARGPLAVPALLAVLEEERFWATDSPGEGWPPIHAAELLGELNDPAAVRPLLRVLEMTDWLELLHDRALTALENLGDDVLEPALEEHEKASDEDYRSSLAAVLSELGVEDQRVFDILVHEFRGGSLGPGSLATYGDPQALPVLSDALDAYHVEVEESFLANWELFELRSAIEDLGGSLTPSQQAKCALAGRIRSGVRAQLLEEMGLDLDLAGEEPSARSSGKLGRNDPCWCGSSRKYKKCHLQEDRASVQPA